MKPEECEYTEPRRFPEYDTVEFEMEGCSTPLQWDPGKKTLNWSKDPGIPAEHQASWDKFREQVLWLLSEEIGNHVPAIAKVQRALDFDRCIAAGQVRVVEPYFQKIPKGAIW